MYKVFIVDDEEKTRRGLSEYFDWGKWGMEVVGVADDGVNAIGDILNLKPDVVLSDVEMRIMDGVELARHLKERVPDTKIIFISGHDDTEYLKSALKLDAIDYILKPIDFDELESVIKKVLNIIDVEVTDRQNKEDMSDKLFKSMPLLKDKFYMNLINNVYRKTELIENQISFLELEIKNINPYCVMLVMIDDYSSILEQITERDRQLLSFGLINVYKELVDKSLGGYVFENKMGEYIAILDMSDTNSNDTLFKLANELKDSIFRCLEVSITIGIGNHVESLFEVHQSYKSALDALAHKLYLGKNRIITMDGIIDNSMIEFQFDGGKWDEITSLLTAAQKTKLSENLDMFFSDLSHAKIVDKSFCQNICIQLIILAERLLYKFEIKVLDEAMQAYTLMKQIYKMDTLENMKLCIQNYYHACCDRICEKRENKLNTTIENAKRIIHERFAKNLTIYELANEVYMAPTYLCLLFRQETGMTINNYLTFVRINKAKEMLQDLGNKIYDVSLAVGYSNPSYFSMQFKKLVGMGPKEYRDKML